MAKNYIDLTLTLEEGMHGVSVEQAKTKTADGWNASTHHLYSHCGTHIDAPFHFDVVSRYDTIDAIPPSRFFVEAWIVDASKTGERGVIGIHDLGDIQSWGLRYFVLCGFRAYRSTDIVRDENPERHPGEPRILEKTNSTLAHVRGAGHYSPRNFLIISRPLSLFGSSSIER